MFPFLRLPNPVNVGLHPVRAVVFHPLGDMAVHVQSKGGADEHRKQIMDLYAMDVLIIDTSTFSPPPSGEAVQQLFQKGASAKGLARLVSVTHGRRCSSSPAAPFVLQSMALPLEPLAPQGFQGSSCFHWRFPLLNLP